CVGSDGGLGRNQLLSNADRLEVHPEDHWDRSAMWRAAEVRLAVDPVDHGVGFQLVIALDGIEIHGPAIVRNRVWHTRTRSRRRTAVKTGPALRRSCLYTRQENFEGVNLRRIVVVHVAGLIGSCGAGYYRVGSVFVGPGREAPRRMNHPVNRVR